MKSMIMNAGKISIDFKDTDYIKGMEVSVQNAREGSISSIGIEYTKDCAVRKEMDQSIVYTDAGNHKKGMLEEAVRGLPEQIFDPAEFISRSMTGEDAKDIEGEDGSILEEYVASSLERALERVKSQRSENAKALERQISNEKEKLEFMEEMENRIRETIQATAVLQEMSDAAASYLLENELPITTENIKASIGSVGQSEWIKSAVSGESFDSIRQQAENMMEQSGLPVNDVTMRAAQTLYENGVALTSDHVITYQKLQSLKQEAADTLMERVTDQVMEGVLPEQADLTKISRREAAEKKEQLIQTDEKTLFRTFPTETEQIRVHRQLEEIRLTMTVDAARRMEHKGIELDIKNLVQIVEELKQMESEASREYLQEAGVESSQTNVTIMSDTLRARADILSAPTVVFGRTIQSATEDTLKDVAVAANEMRQQMENAYEAVGTEVRRDLGDSIHKAFGNVDDILEELGIEKTSANQRAVRILAYNRMDLTKENIFRMKEYDSKVTDLVKDLRPAVVAELIRRKDNPLEMNLDELAEKVSQISEEIGQEDVSLRKYLWKLDHGGAISEEERKSMIGIYRLLDKVKKSDGAVIGQVVRDGRELSFASLLSAVRSRKSQGIDRKVDDNFGETEKIITTGESISEQIQTAFESRVVSKLQKELSPAVLLQRKDSFLDDSLEFLLDECRENEMALQENDAYYKEQAIVLRQMAAEGDEQVVQWLNQLQMPHSLLNMHLVKTYMEQGSKEYLQMFSREDSEKIIDAMDDPENLQNIYEEKEKEILHEIEETKQSEDVTSEQVKELAVMAGNISFYHTMRKYQRYEVPLVTEQGVTACTVTVKQGKDLEKGTVEIFLESAQMGMLQATFKLTENRISGFVTSEEENTLDLTHQIFNEFRRDLEQNGFSVEREDFAKGTRNMLHLGEEKTEKVTNERLYLVAKLFIQNVQRKEDEL